MFAERLSGYKGTKTIPSFGNIHCPQVPRWAGWGQGGGGTQEDPCPEKWRLRQHCWSPENPAPMAVNLWLASTRKKSPEITTPGIVAMAPRLFFLPLPLILHSVPGGFLTPSTDQVHFLHCPRGNLILLSLHGQAQ